MFQNVKNVIEWEAGNKQEAEIMIKENNVHFVK